MDGKLAVWKGCSWEQRPVALRADLTVEWMAVLMELNSVAPMESLLV